MKFEIFFAENKKKTIDLYVDMDGVLAEFDIGNFDYSTIRPIKTIIARIKHLNTLSNINVKVLSVCKTNKIVDEKYIWFEKHANFFNKNQLIFLSKENEINYGLESMELKNNYLSKNININNITVLVDDDNQVLSYIKKNNRNIVLFQDSSLVD